MTRFNCRFFQFIAFLASVGVLFVGCQTYDQTSTPGRGNSGSSTNSPGPDLIWSGDRLLITFSDLPQPEKPFEVTVAENGQINLPENLKITAAGKKKDQLEQEIRGLYVPNYYTRLTVNITTSDRYFTVLGEVKNPSPRPYVGGMTVLKAIAAAGGFTEYANKSVEIIRANQQKQRVNTKKAQKHPTTLDLPIYPNDLIVVRRRSL